MCVCVCVCVCVYVCVCVCVCVCVHACACLHALVYRMLIKLSQSMTDPGRRAVLNDVACTLFFHLTVQVCEETNFYPPTKQFFTSCVEILGQVSVTVSGVRETIGLRSVHSRRKIFLDHVLVRRGWNS